MIGKTTSGFWKCFDQLPRSIQRIAKAKYQVWQRDPFHPSFHFKELHPPIWSVRVNEQYRALARRKGDLVVWFWIGSHAEYDRLIEA